MNRARHCWSILLLTVATGLAFGQEKGFYVEPKPAEVLEKQAGVGERYALIIGISKYANPNINLNYADKDAQSLDAVLLDSEIGAYKKDNVRLLVNEEATRKNIMSALNSWLGARVKPEDSVLIFYSGHGALGNGSEAYWVTYDADVEDLYSSAMSNKEISQLIGALPAKRKLTLIDSCYSEATAKKYRAIVPNDVFSEFGGAGVVTITASSGQEKSVEVGGHGAFTYHLLAGMEGKADTNGNGVVELDELWNYLNEKVQKTAADAGNKQTPVLLAERMEHGFPLTINPAKASGTTLNQLKKMYGDGKITVEEVGEAEQLLTQRGADPEIRKLYQDLAFGVLTPDYFRRLRGSTRADAKPSGVPPASGAMADTSKSSPEMPAGATPAEVTAYRAAELLNTPQSWQQFLTQYGNGVLAEQARAKIWGAAVAAGAGHPEVKPSGAPPASGAMADASKSSPEIPAAPPPAEVTAYHAAELLNSGEAWQQFLTQYPSSVLVDRARAKLFELQNAQQAEALAYEMSKASDTEEGWRQYLTRFPIGTHIAEAKSRIDQL